MQWTICKSSRCRLAYTVDGLVLAMFAASLLDILTTYLFISLELGAEMNPVCAQLIRQSLLWIPVYLSAHPLLVPLAPEIPRRSFAVFFVASGLLFGINNLGGILFHRCFIVDTFGFWIPFGFCVLVAAAYFFYELYRHPENRLVPIGVMLGFLGLFLMIEGAFYVLGLALQTA